MRKPLPYEKKLLLKTKIKVNPKIKEKTEKLQKQNH